MSMKQFFMSKINEGMVVGDDKLIKEYEEKLQEELRKEYVEQMKQLMKATK